MPRPQHSGVVDLRRSTKLLLSSCSAVSIVRPSSCLAVEHVVMLVGGIVGCNCWMVSSSWSRSSSCLAAGVQLLDGVVKLVGGTEQAVVEHTAPSPNVSYSVSALAVYAAPAFVAEFISRRLR